MADADISFPACKVGICGAEAGKSRIAFAAKVLGEKIAMSEGVAELVREGHPPFVFVSGIVWINIAKSQGDSYGQREALDAEANFTEHAILQLFVRFVESKSSLNEPLDHNNAGSDWQDAWALAQGVNSHSFKQAFRMGRPIENWRYSAGDHLERKFACFP